MPKRRKFTAEYKAQVVLELLTEQKSIAQISREYNIKDTVISPMEERIHRTLPEIIRARLDHR
jgi:transposase-like protein